PGKIKLIATGFAEAAIAVRSAVEYFRPGQKARVQYSSIAGIPKGQSETHSTGLQPEAERARSPKSA
ncbi:MAG: hypothetical protein WA741_14275, partial [Candidatus Sulfotelmatobacter sp.]